MSETGYLLQRRREARLHRFGLGLGAVVALAIHAAVFWGPDVEYRPLLERARVRRVLVARPYQPADVRAPPPAEAPGRTGGDAPQPVPSQSPPKPQPELAPPETPRAEQAQQPPSEGPDSVDRSVRSATGDRGAAGSARPQSASESRQAAPVPGEGDAWSVLMADLAERKETIEREWEERRRDVAAAPGRAEAQAGSGRGGVADQEYLDSLIRTTVVSYPPSSIEDDPPPISYPDLRFYRRQLQAGICRVYYRVWTDGFGRIRRTQLKTPSTPAERERYAPFIEAVEVSVAEWPFERMEAEVHIDVLFEIE